MPAVGVQHRATLRSLERKPGLLRDPAGCDILRGVLEGEPVQAQRFERPRGHSRQCSRGGALAAGCAGNPVAPEEQERARAHHALATSILSRLPTWGWAYFATLS